MTEPQDNKIDLLAMASEIVSAHIANNKIERADLPGFIREVYQTLASLEGTGGAMAMGAREPAVPIKKSVSNEAIICLECGASLKMLKRHLATHHQMTLDQYRQKWALPNDYPMVAPAYAKKRSTLAKQIGLGQSRGNGKRRGRPKKA